MNKQIFSVGWIIPALEEYYIDFDKSPSLMDADILLISPASLRPHGDWVTFSGSDSGCYNVEASNRYKQRMVNLKKEVEDHLNSGKTVFIFLDQEEKYQLANSVNTTGKNSRNYSTETYSNYNFLPINIGKLTSATGKNIMFSGNAIFSKFYNQFLDHLSYKAYLEDIDKGIPIFTGKQKAKVLGSFYNVGTGHLVVMPVISYDEKEFTETKKYKDGTTGDFWNKKGSIFGNNFVNCLLEIDGKLSGVSIKTPPPEWLLKKEFSGKKEEHLKGLIHENHEKIRGIEQDNQKISLELQEEESLKDLLFEQGKPLENAVIRALKILGYQAENYDDGVLEMDQIIISPEKYRYIGETEGKDNKDVDVTKFRQLLDALNADYEREEVKERAFGILFGNAERLKEPATRKLDFTAKCKSGAEREKIALIKTVDLFKISKYLNENTDEQFKKDCRNAINEHLGRIVVFPKIPEPKDK